MFSIHLYLTHQNILLFKEIYSVFKELFPPFKVNLIEPLLVQNKKLQNTNRIGTQIQEGSGMVQNSVMNLERVQKKLAK
jgi:hypothetical protein